MKDLSAIALSRKQMAWRAAQDIADGAYVNLGIGMPTLCSGYVPEGRRVTYQSENGILGVGPAPGAGEEDFDLINASKDPVTLQPGASFVVQADSFAMIRGGHIDIAVLGAFQIATNGDLANWSTGSGGVPAVGGAMDLVAGVKSVYCLTTHVTKTGEHKLLEACTYPLTGVGVVTRVYTDLAVVEVKDGAFTLRELVDGISLDEIRDLTGAPLTIADDLKAIEAPAL